MFEGGDYSEEFGALVCWCGVVGTAREGFGVGFVGALAGFGAGGCGTDGWGVAVVATAAVDVDFHCVAHFEEGVVTMDRDGCKMRMPRVCVIHP